MGRQQAGACQDMRYGVEDLERLVNGHLDNGRCRILKDLTHVVGRLALHADDLIHRRVPG